VGDWRGGFLFPFVLTPAFFNGFSGLNGSAEGNTVLTDFPAGSGGIISFLLFSFPGGRPIPKRSKTPTLIWVRRSSAPSKTIKRFGPAA
jgi:hypothetical protein